MPQIRIVSGPVSIEGQSGHHAFSYAPHFGGNNLEGKRFHRPMNG